MKKHLLDIIVSCVVAVIVAVALQSCAGKSGECEALPCRTGDDGSWSFVTTGGDIVECGLSDRPSGVYDGRFWFSGHGDYWMLYRFDGDGCARVADTEFRFVSDFYGGRAFAVPRNGDISVIDKEGKVVLTLDSAGGSAVRQILDPADGIVRATGDNGQGAVDDRGNVIVPLKYYYTGKASSGRVVALSGPDGLSPGGNGSVFVYDYSGEVVFHLKNGRYDDVALAFTGGYLPVGRRLDGDICWGLLDTDGNKVMEPRKGVEGIEEIRGPNIIFNGEDGVGIMSLKGDVVVEPRYDNLYFLTDKLLGAGMKDEADTAMVYQIIDVSGRVVVQRKFADIVYAGGDRLFVQLAGGRWEMSDMKGEPVESAVTLSSLDYTPCAGNGVLSSDKVDLGQLLATARVSAHGAGDFTFDTSARDALPLAGSATPDPESFIYTKSVSGTISADGEDVSVTLFYPEYITRQRYRDERVIDGTFGFWTYSHVERVPDGYEFTSAKPRAIRVSFSNRLRLRGKLRPLFNELVRRFSASGKVLDNNGAATLVDAGNGRKALITLGAHDVSVVVGYLDDDECSIESYKGAREILPDLND